MSEAEALRLLLERLDGSHPQRAYVESERHNREAGVRGESRIESKFKEFFIPEDFEVFWDVGLAIGDWRVQFDGLLLTGRCAVIIESKNISDELYFDEATGEFYRKNAGGRHVFEHPAVQLNKNRYFLEQWFRRNRIALPVEGLVVFTAKQCEFMTKPTLARMCKLYQMPGRLIEILKKYPPVCDAPFREAARRIPQQLVPYRRKPVCEKYFISMDDLKKGIFCAECRLPSVRLVERSWVCGSCGARERDIGARLIDEYFAVVGEELTNRGIREYFGIESQDVVTRMLRKADLSAYGEQKGRFYRKQPK
ncbi:nuclease-related domain-containing protein [Indiicoccus explosivorum]|uniref:nuclease-related domain-containing protein n=1 Tax=Indiicoccus explosivorum TaxID=1917864 RepID=UPI00139015DF|nr:nuclease-related domain-containing protein [Indiicoccus explosivorum]